MEQFNLDKWLQDKSRKVTTRLGNRKVRIICWDRKNNNNRPIITLMIDPDGNEYVTFHTKNGFVNEKEKYIDKRDLFFADEEEEPQSIEIPFGAFDSEFVKDEYLIPEGCEARIEGNKVIIEKIQKEEELTEFEKAVRNILARYISNIDCFPETIKDEAKPLLDLARKEILKDFPKWKKMPNGIQGNGNFNPTYLVRVSNGHYFTTPCLSWDKDSMYLELSELEKLQKEV